ncbi:MAG: alpha/beta fold hydrolase [Pelagimonas sp.]|uniref:alpha/beta fold hydrolase n=1 Tax=Pelagimonas sp. TaxID=2073170 RepID=UPI003D6A43ED
MLRRLGWLITAFALLYLGYASLMIWLHPRFIYPFYPDTFSASGFKAFDVAVDGAEPLPVQVARGRKGAPTVVYFMGNVGSLKLFRAMLEHHRAAGRHVVAMPYRGGGGVPGEPSESTLKRDALAVFDALPKLGVSGPVIVQGYSLGTGLALQVASHRKLAGVILAAPYEKMCQLMTAASFLPACILPGVQRWDSAALAPAVSDPVLILHGNKDALIPMSHGQNLAQLLPDARFVKIDGAGHTNLFGTKPYLAKIDAFISQVSGQ